MFHPNLAEGLESVSQCLQTADQLVGTDVLGDLKKDKRFGHRSNH